MEKCLECEHYNNGMGSLTPCLKCRELNKKLQPLPSRSFTMSVDDIIDGHRDDKKLKSVFECLLKYFSDKEVMLFIKHFMYGDSYRQLEREYGMDKDTILRKLEGMREKIKKELGVYE